MTAPKIEAHANQRSRAKHFLKLLLLPIFLFYLLIVFTHRFWLPKFADLLVLQNQPHQADIIVVATPFRPRFQHALNLFQKEYADQILLIGDVRIKCS